MAVAHANPDDLRKLQAAVKNAQSDIDQAIRKLQNAYRGADWNDSASKQFEGKLNDAVSAVSQTNRRLGELNPILQRKLSELSQYLGR